MKSLLTISLCLTSLASAHEATIAWNPSPEPYVDGYRIYTRTVDQDGERGEWNALIAVPADQTAMVQPNDLDKPPVLAVVARPEFPDELVEVAVTAFTGINPDDPDFVGVFESGFSEPIEMSPGVSEPSGLFRVITEQSIDMTDWEPIATQVVEMDENGKKFFRTRIEPVEP